MSNKLSVYGSTGFIGSNFCQLYDCEEIERDERKPLSSEIIYLISTTHNYNVLNNSFIDIDTNLCVLMETLDACRSSNIKTFNFISSWFVYGDTTLPASEISYCNPKGFYSITKRCAEQLLISYCQTFDLDYRILRLGNVYGKTDQNASKKRNALQYLINRLKNNHDISLYDEGKFYRNFMHVTDVCRAIKKICDAGEKNEIYNIGSMNSYLFKDIIQIAVEKLQSTSRITSMDPPGFHKIVQVRDMKLDTRKLYNLGFEETILIKNGIEELCEEF
jgi:nucleoside-diphosphate-sugar epimerase|tara:strand:- start:3423 stop:4250 length:828 start_codon:yes stop_codon:yes gene_type:complete